MVRLRIHKQDKLSIYTRPCNPKRLDDPFYKHKIYKFRGRFYPCKLSGVDFRKNHLNVTPLIDTAEQVRRKGYKFDSYA